MVKRAGRGIFTNLIISSKLKSDHVDHRQRRAVDNGFGRGWNAASGTSPSLLPTLTCYFTPSDHPPLPPPTESVKHTGINLGAGDFI